MTDEQKKILVKYVANADPNEGTAAANLSSGETLEIGGDPKFVTAQEFVVLSGRLQLQVYDENSDEYKAAVAAAEEEAQAKALAENPNADVEAAKSKAALEKLAAAEDPPVDLSEASNNEERADAIIQARSAKSETGEASLPATATAGSGGAPAAGGGGSETPAPAGGVGNASATGTAG